MGEISLNIDELRQRVCRQLTDPFSSSLPLNHFFCSCPNDAGLPSRRRHRVCAGAAAAAALQRLHSSVIMPGSLKSRAPGFLLLQQVGGGDGSGSGGK